MAEDTIPKLKELKANAHSIVDSLSTAAPLLGQGELWLAPMSSRHVAALIVKGAPLARAEPKEGPFLLLNTVTLVKNAPLQVQGKDFINRLLSDKVQLPMATANFTGPTVRTVQVPADLRKLVPFGPEEAAKMISLDWEHVIKNRAKWIDRWNKEIAS